MGLVESNLHESSRHSDSCGIRLDGECSEEIDSPNGGPRDRFQHQPSSTLGRAQVERQLGSIRNGRIQSIPRTCQIINDCWATYALVLSGRNSVAGRHLIKGAPTFKLYVDIPLYQDLLAIK